MRQNITRQSAHVIDEANQLVRYVEKDDRRDIFLSTLIVDGTHPYLYENPAISNHVSGTTYIDMSRQLMKAICHLYFDIPLEFRFALHDLTISFPQWAATEKPIDVEAKLTLTCKKPKARFYTGESHVICRQHGALVMSGTSQFSTFPERIEAFMMRRAGLE